MARNHWTILGELDPELNDKITAWRTQLVNDNAKLERKYRELINVAMACILKQEPGYSCTCEACVSEWCNKGRDPWNSRTGPYDGRFPIIPYGNADFG